MTSQKNPRLPVRLVPLLAALSLVLAACGGSEETEAGVDGDSAGQPSQDAPSDGDTADSDLVDGDVSLESDPMAGDAVSEADLGDDSGSIGGGDPMDGELPTEGPPGGGSSAIYQPIGPMEDLVDPQPAPIDEVVAEADQVILVRYQNAYEPCAGAQVTVVESDTSIEVSLETGLNPNAAAMTCLAGSTGYEQTVVLSAPIGDRDLVLTEASELGVAQPGDGQAVPSEPAEDPSEPAKDPSDPTKEEQAQILAPYIGLELAEAATKADAEGRALRVAELDGAAMVLTEDYVPSRLNVSVEDGLVVGGYLG